MTKISYAVYRNNTGLDQAQNAELGYQVLVNNLFKDFDWLSTPQYFENSPELAGYRLTQDSDDHREILFLEWFLRLCGDFLVTKNEYLLILQDCIWLPDSFSKKFLQLIDLLPMHVDMLSLFNSAAHENHLQDGVFIETATSSNLAFVISKKTATLFISGHQLAPGASWNELLSSSHIRTFACNSDSEARVFVYTETWTSQNSFAHNASVATLGKNVRDSYTLGSLSQVKVHAVISHWHSTWDNVGIVEEACKQFGYKISVLNSTEVKIANWINQVPIEYFRQIESACESFDLDNEFLLFIQADHKSSLWSDYFLHVTPYLSLPETGTLTPTTTNNGFSRRSLFPNAKFDYRDHLSIFPYNDINIIYIRKSIVLRLREFFAYFNSTQDWKPSLGAGVVDLMNHITSDLGLVHLRDYCYCFMNPFSRGWSSAEGVNELFPMLEIASKFEGAVVEPNVQNFERVSGIFLHP